jgi:ataxia telangiectasia mutated family protein
MQQLFGVVNQFLAHSSETSKRQLALRCYKVVPLSPTAGVIEMVSAVSLSDLLLSDDGLHRR